MFSPPDVEFHGRALNDDSLSFTFMFYDSLHVSCPLSSVPAHTDSHTDYFQDHNLNLGLSDPYAALASAMVLGPPLQPSLPKLLSL